MRRHREEALRAFQERPEPRFYPPPNQRPTWPPQDRLLTREEVFRLFGIRPALLEALVKRGDLKPVYQNGRVLYRQSDLQRRRAL